MYFSSFLQWCNLKLASKWTTTWISAIFSLTASAPGVLRPTWLRRERPSARTGVEISEMALLSFSSRFDLDHSSLGSLSWDNWTPSRLRYVLAFEKKKHKRLSLYISGLTSTVFQTYRHIHELHIIFIRHLTTFLIIGRYLIIVKTSVVDNPFDGYYTV